MTRTKTARPLSTSCPRTGRGARARETATSTRATLSRPSPRILPRFHAPKSVNRGRIQRGSKSPEDSLAFSRRGTCGENEGESTDSETREREVCRERATSPPPPPEGKGEEEASPLTPDKCPEALPPLSLDRDRAGGEEAPPDTPPGAPETPPASPCPPKGREEEEGRSPRARNSRRSSARGESAEQREQSLKGDVSSPCRIVS